MALFDRFRRIDKAPAVPAGTVQLSDTTVAAMMQNPPSAATAEALQRNPLDYTVPFSPGRPLIPALINPPREDGRATPRRYEFPVAWNIQISQQRLVPYQLLRDTSDQADIVRKCIEVVKGAIGGMEWTIGLTPEATERFLGESGRVTQAQASRIAREKYTEDITRAKDFWKMPDRINGLSFPEWVGMALEEMLVIDALSIYPNRTLDNEALHSLEILDGTTIKPLLDDRGARPVAPHAAFQQILWGFPRGEFTASNNSANEFTADDLMYVPKNRRAHTPYGYSAVERSLPLVDLYLKRIQWLRTEFTDGVTPDMFIKTDAGYGNNPELLRGYEQIFNDSLSGNTEQRRRARLLPSGMDPVFSPSWDTKYNSEFDDWLVKAICGHFGVLPTQIGFTPKTGLGGKGHQEGEAQSAELLGLRPIVVWLTDLLNQLSYRFLGMPEDLTFVLSDGTTNSEHAVIDRLKSEVQNGLRTFNEARSELGLPLYSIPEADMPAVYAGANITPVSAMLTAFESVTGQPQPAPAPTRTTIREQLDDETDTEAATKPADDTDKTVSINKELSAFIKWSKNARSRPFLFEFVDDDTALKLSALATEDVVAAAELARTLKAGGMRPKVRRGREPFPANHPARKPSDRLVAIYEKKFASLGNVNSEAIAKQFLANPTHDPRQRNVRPFGSRGEQLLKDLYVEAGWMGKAASSVLIARSRKAGKSLDNPDDDIDWGMWIPGNPAAAAYLLTDGMGAGMRELLAKARITIKGIEDTQLDRISEILADAMEQGLGSAEAARLIRDIVGDPVRAQLIAHTEMARANAAATKDNYAANFVEQVDWQTSGDAFVCEECADLEAGSPYDLNDAPEWPDHPNCGCQLIPAAFYSSSMGIELADTADILKAEGFKPTAGMKAEAKKGLAWRKEFNRGGTEVGVARARDIINDANLPLDTVKRMHSFFSRHEVDKKGKGFYPSDEGFPSAGRIAWALWGGDAGQKWSRKIAKRMESDSKNNKQTGKFMDSADIMKAHRKRIDRALEKLDELPEKDGLIEVPWKIKERPDIDHDEWANSKLRAVSIDELYATQEYVKKKNIKWHIEHPGETHEGKNAYPNVIKNKEGKRLIYDGHHRLAALWLLGADEALAWYLKEQDL